MYLSGKRVLFLVLCVGLLGGAAWATDCSKVPNDDKFLPSRITLISGITMETNEVRRPAKMITIPKASIAVWCPWMEPPPVERLHGNVLDGRKAKIYKNNGTTRDRFPFIVADWTVEPKKYYVFRNVRYQWIFETSPGDTDGGNVTGKSGVDPWSPFFKQTYLEAEVVPFIERFALEAIAPDGLSEKKVFVNRHTTVYDSGVQGNTQVAESSILQQVGMKLTFERAEIDVGSGSTPAPEGPGYPEGDFDSADLPDPDVVLKGAITLNAAPADDAFQKGEVINPVPDPYKPVWTLGPCSAYTLCYVEDYKKPEGKPQDSRGETYHGSIGGFLEGGVTIEYEDDNVEANAKSDQMNAKFKYYLGNADIYKVENPFYGDNEHPTYNLPYLHFFYVRSNYEFGPYCCGAQKGREPEWYANGHPYWKNKNSTEIIDYVTTRYGNAWSSNSIPSWEMGVVYCTLGLDGKGKNAKFNTEQLNAAWQKGSMAECTVFQNLKADLSIRKTGAAAKAMLALTALEQAIQSPESMKIRNDRTFYRFAPAGYDSDRGSYCVGPQKLEKDNPKVHEEWVTEKKGIAIKKGKWILAEKRLILPAKYSTCACDQSHTDAFTSKQVLQIVVADCCGNMTTVNPSTENTRDGIIIRDDTPASPPIPEMTIEDPQTHGEIKIAVPCDDNLRATEKLVIRNKRTGAIGKYRPNEFGGDFNLAENDFSIEREDGKIEPLAVIPDGSTTGRPSIFEDTRVQLGGGGYDNIDGTTSFRGIGKTRITVYSLDGSLNRVGPEQLEFVDQTGNVRTADYFERVNSGDPYKFDPNFKFMHIFRKPGWYQIEYRVWENANTTGEKKSRALIYNLQVADSKTSNRDIGGTEGTRAQ